MIKASLLNAFLLGLIFFQHATSQAQNTPLPINPPSANATALGKYGDVGVSLYTGLPSIEIPLWTVKGRSISFPVSLSYYASGIQVQEDASSSMEPA
jgi:hypothetical protein